MTLPINKKIAPTPRKPFQFELPKDLECSKPTEVRGINRDDVGLLVSHIDTNKIHHNVFKNVGNYLQEGDVLVVNTSGTLKAAITATFPNGSPVNIHFSTQQKNGSWIIELRTVTDQKNTRFNEAKAGTILQLDHGGQVQLIKPYYQNDDAKNHLQLWITKLYLKIPLETYLERYGTPIRYNYLKEVYPTEYYQTVFANEIGSAEMPSAGRAFTSELVIQLIAKGVQIIPILLHTGVASLELDEQPYEEYFRISNLSAQLLNLAKKENRRIIAVGTTVIRAIETMTDKFSFTQGGKGWTDIFITPERGIFGVDGLLTGFHEPKASHLLMLEALAGRDHLEVTYQEAVNKKYKWHEFGDLHLILP